MENHTRHITTHPIESTANPHPIDPIDTIADTRPIDTIADTRPIGIIVAARPIGTIVDTRPIGIIVDARPIESIVDARPIGIIADAHKRHPYRNPQPLRHPAHHHPRKNADSPYADGPCARPRIEPIDIIVNARPIGIIANTRPIGIIVNAHPIDIIVNARPIESITHPCTEKRCPLPPKALKDRRRAPHRRQRRRLEGESVRLTEGRRGFWRCCA